MIIILLILLLLIPLPVQAADIELWEHNNFVPTDNTSAYGQYWLGQSFTSDNTSHTINYVRLRLRSVGSPGNAVMMIREAPGGTPSGTDLASVTITENQLGAAGEWMQVNLAAAITIDARTQYWIGIKAPDGDASNFVQWKRSNASVLPDGTAMTSTGGVSWTNQAYDFMFEVWGEVSVEIQDVKVFRSYSETNDWLITLRYLNIYKPYYDTYDVKKYFTVQFRNASGNVTAQNVLPSWGNRVASIYLSAAAAAPLTWGNTAYSVHIYGVNEAVSQASENITATSWLGDDMANLDSWVISSASVISDYYDTSMTTYIADRGEVLNATGGSIFDSGISGLGMIRPNLFQIVTNKLPYSPETVTQAGRLGVTPITNAGTKATVEATRLGTMFGGASSTTVIGFIFIAMAVMVAVWSFPSGHTTAAMALCFPIAALGIFFGLNWIFIAGVGIIAIFLFVKKVWIDVGN